MLEEGGVGCTAYVLGWSVIDGWECWMWSDSSEDAEYDGLWDVCCAVVVFEGKDECMGGVRG